MPIRRAGSPVQDSRGSEDREGDAGAVQHPRGRDHLLAAPLVERARAPDPVEVLDVVGDRVGRRPAPRSRALRASRSAWPPRAPRGHPGSRGCAAAARPRSGSATPSAPRSGACRRSRRCARCRRGTPRRTRRTSCSSRARRGRSTEGTSVSPSCGSPARRRSAEVKRLSRSPMIRSFGLSGLPVFHAGHCDWHRPHSVQVAKSSICFQVNSPDVPDAEDRVLGHVLHVHVRGLVEPAERAGSARGRHVDRREEDVQVLRVRHEHEERGDHRDVEDAGRSSRSRSFGGRAERGEPARDGVARKRPGRRRRRGSSPC